MIIYYFWIISSQFLFLFILKLTKYKEVSMGLLLCQRVVIITLLLLSSELLFTVFCRFPTLSGSHNKSSVGVIFDHADTSTGDLRPLHNFLLMIITITHWIFLFHDLWVCTVKVYAYDWETSFVLLYTSWYSLPHSEQKQESGSDRLKGFSEPPATMDTSVLDVRAGHVGKCQRRWVALRLMRHWKHHTVKVKATFVSVNEFFLI